MKNCSQKMVHCFFFMFACLKSAHDTTTFLGNLT